MGRREKLDQIEYGHFEHRRRRGRVMQRDHAPDTVALIIRTRSVGSLLIAVRLGDRKYLFRVVMAATRPATRYRGQRFGDIDRVQRVVL